MKSYKKGFSLLFHMYNSRVLEYFKNPKFSGKLKEFNGIGVKGNPSCGDEMKVYINVIDGKIKDISYETFGCVAAIANSEALCRMAKGKTVSEALKIKSADILKHLGTEMPKEKIHCSVLGAEALHLAIEDYKKRSK